MTTLGNIAYVAPSKLVSYKCPPGSYISELKGVHNPNGALGVQAICNNGAASQYFGAPTGTPFSIKGSPAIPSFYSTGGMYKDRRFVSSVGTTATTQNGPKGGTVFQDVKCPAGSYFSSVSLSGTGSQMTDIAFRTCGGLPEDKTPIPGAKTGVFSCPEGLGLDVMTQVRDANGQLVGIKFGCNNTNKTGRSYSPQYGTTKGTSLAYSSPTLYGSATAPLQAGASKGMIGAVACPSKQAYGAVAYNVDSETGITFTPQKCITPIAGPVPVVVAPDPSDLNHSQAYNCPSGTYIRDISSAMNPNGSLTAQFRCSDIPPDAPQTTQSLLTSLFGTPNATLETKTSPYGFTQINTSSKKMPSGSAGTMIPGMTAMTATRFDRNPTADTIGVPSDTTAIYACPAGQVVTGVTGVWSKDQIKQLLFRCGAAPILPPVTEIPPDETLPYDPTVPTGGNTYVPDPANPGGTLPGGDIYIPPTPNNPTGTIPANDPYQLSQQTPTTNTSSSNTLLYLLIFMIFVIVIAVVLIVRKYRANKLAASAATPTV